MGDVLRAHFAKAGQLASILLIPIIFFWIIFSIKTGPQGSSFHNDPDAYYLGNGLLAATGEDIFLMEHPGIPGSLLAAGLIRIKFHLFPESPLPLPDEVLLNPSPYHYFLGNCVLFLNASALFFFGAALLRLGTPLIVAIFCQSIYLALAQPLHFSGRLLPEGLAMTTTIAFGVWWLSALSERYHIKSLGLLLGIATSLKINFFPFAILAFSSKKLRHSLAVALISISVFYFFSIFLSEARQSLLVRYFVSFIFHKGSWGGGEMGFPSPLELYQNGITTWQEDPLFGKVIVFFLGLSLIQFLHLFVIEKERRLKWIQIVGISVVCVSILATLKHPGSRYLLPASLFFPILMAGFYLRAGRIATIASMAFVAIFVSINWNEYLTYANNISLNKAALNHAAAVQEHAFRDNPNCIKLFTATSPSREWDALSMQTFSGGIFDKKISHLYPDSWFLNFEPAHFHSFSKKASVAEFLEEIGRYPCLLFLTRNDFIPTFHRELFLNANWEVLYSSSTVDLLLLRKDELRKLRVNPLIPR